MCTGRAYGNARRAALYNRPMRAVHLLLLLGMACGNALAQTPSPSPAPAAAGAQREALPDPEPLSGRSNQRTERIQIEVWYANGHITSKWKSTVSAPGCAAGPLVTAEAFAMVEP